MNCEFPDVQGSFKKGRRTRDHTAKGFGIVNKAEINVFLELPCFLDDSANAGNLISDSSDFSKISLNIGNFPVHVLVEA